MRVVGSGQFRPVCIECRRIPFGSYGFSTRVDYFFVRPSSTRSRFIFRGERAFPGLEL
jgi:hypothetical protein